MHQPSRQLLTVLLALLVGSAYGAEGLSTPTADRVWPQWQARITLSMASLNPVSLSGGITSSRGLIQSGAVLSDYYIDSGGLRPASLSGGLRATGGLLLGPRALALGDAAPMGVGQRLGLAVQGSAAPWFADNGSDAVPYLGLGYTGFSTKGGWGFTADFGLIAENPLMGVGHFGRALLGNQPFDNTVHDLRISPMLQVGVRYAF